MLTTEFVHGLESVVGPSGIITNPNDMLTYESDGLARLKATPGCVVLPDTAAEVQQIVRLCHEHNIPFIARGHGTGLSGGALPRPDAVLIGVVEAEPRHRRRHPEPAHHGRAWRHQPRRHAARGAERLLLRARPVEPADLLDRRKRRRKFRRRALPEIRVHRAPCARRSKPCCPTATWCTSAARRSTRPDSTSLGALVGSEGTLAVVTKVTLRIVRVPEAVKTILAAFASTEAAGAAVSEIISAGIIPGAVEMMDRLTVEAAEAAVHPNFPKAEAVLIVELDGAQSEVEGLFQLVEAICHRTGGTEILIARNNDERARIWKGRKAAFAAMGRVSPNYYVQDGVIPRTKLAGGARPHPRARTALGAAHRQRVPCRRRQSPSAHLL